MSFGKILECFSLASPAGSCSCFCMNTMDDQLEGRGQDIESKPLITSDNKEMMRLKDLIDGTHQTLAFQLKPKVRSFFQFSFVASFYLFNLFSQLVELLFKFCEKSSVQTLSLSFKNTF